jgi:hypothetical protein
VLDAVCGTITSHRHLNVLPNTKEMCQMAWVIANTKDIARVAWFPIGGPNVWFRSYSGSAGAKPLSVKGIPRDFASVLTCLMAIGASHPMKFSVVDEPKLDGPTYTASYAQDMIIGLLELH